MTTHPASAPGLDSSDPIVARVRGPGELVAAVPVLMGFQPERSLVALLLRQKQVALTMRSDLPGLTDTRAWRTVAEQFRLGAHRSGGTVAVLVLYSEDSVLTDPVQRVVAQALREVDIEVLDVLRVHGGRYYGVQCRDPRCCPPDGTPVPGDTPVQAHAVVEGRVVRPTREALADEIEPVDPAPLADRVRALSAAKRGLRAGTTVVPVEGMPARLDEAVDQARAGLLSLEQAALLTALMLSGDHRDEVYRHLSAGSAADHRVLWGAVCRLLPGPMSLVPHVLFALSAYIDGSGALAAIVQERAVDWDPTHPTVRLVDDIMRYALPPREVIAVLARAVAPER